jgi:hypothetical protein
MKHVHMLHHQSAGSGLERFSAQRVKHKEVFHHQWAGSTLGRVSAQRVKHKEVFHQISTATSLRSGTDSFARCSVSRKNWELSGS